MFETNSDSRGGFGGAGSNDSLGESKSEKKRKEQIEREDKELIIFIQKFLCRQ